MSISPPRRRTVRARAGGRAGFTLIELVVALVISGLVAGIIFQVLTGQGRFVAQQTAREEVLQNARGALDVLGSELRGVHPQGLVIAERDSIEFFSPRVWGMVCANVSSGSSQVTAIFPDVPDVTFDVGSGGALPATAGVQFALGDPVSGTWPTASVASLTNRSLGDCGAISPGADNVRVVRFTTTGGSLPAIAQGTWLYYFQRVRYSLGGDASVPGTWVLRTTGKVGSTLVQKPFAGPVPASGADGLEFSYFREGVSTPAARLGTAAERKQARSVGVRITTESQPSDGGPRQSIADSVTIYLRNQGGL